MTGTANSGRSRASCDRLDGAK